LTRRAELRPGRAGLVPDGDGWFVVNIAEAQAVKTDKLGEAVLFEDRTSHRFPEFGINVHVLRPGQPNAMYHRENAQEAFLVLSGECVAIVDDEEHRLRRGDFLYTPPGTDHVLVGAGDGPCAILMVGTRKDPEEVVYPVSAVAAEYGASVPEETSDATRAYEGLRPEYGTLGLPW
jgi:uncharacterized cupin superfamily protein